MIQIFKLVLFILFLQIEASLKTILEYNQHNFNFQDSTKNALPERYQYLSQIYYCIKHSSEKQNVVGILQFFKNTSTVFPTDIVNKIGLLIAERFCIFSKIEIFPNIPSRYKDVFTHFTVTSLMTKATRVGGEKPFVYINHKKNSTLEALIQEFKSNYVNQNDFNEAMFRNINKIREDITSITKPIDMELSWETYNNFLTKTRDYHIYINDNLKDPKNNSCIIGSTITIKNLKSQAKDIWKFPNYIVLNADLSENGILAVETIDEKIYSNEYGDSHFHNTPYPKNHAIDIYDIFTKTLLNRIKLKLPKEYEFKQTNFSLYMITNEEIYIFKKENKEYLCISYNNNYIIPPIQVPEVEVIREKVSLEKNSEGKSCNNANVHIPPSIKINTKTNNDPILNIEIPKIEVIREKVFLKNETDNPSTPPVQPATSLTTNTNEKNNTNTNGQNYKNSLMRYVRKMIKQIIFISSGFAILFIFKKYFSPLIFKPTRFS